MARRCYAAEGEPTDKTPLPDSNATDSEAYLSDAQGRSVTPIIRPREFREASSSRVVPAALRHPGRLARMMGQSSQEGRKAAQALEGLEKQQKAVGVLMEKGGATMANRKRRRGFLDDEDFEDERESDGIAAPDVGEDDEDVEMGEGDAEGL